MTKRINYVSKATDGTYTLIIKGNVMKVVDKENNEGVKTFARNEKFDIGRGFWNCFKQIKEARKLPKIGDKVKIIDDGECYGTYWTWFEDYNMAMQFDYAMIPDTTKTYEVVAIGPHEEYKEEIIVAVENAEGKIYLVNSRGLVKA